MRPFALLVLLAIGCADPPPDTKRTPAPSAQSDDLMRGLELYAKYPPPEWGPHVVERIASRTINRPLITPDQREFVQEYRLWDLARRYIESGGGPR